MGSIVQCAYICRISMYIYGDWPEQLITRARGHWRASFGLLFLTDIALIAVTSHFILLLFSSKLSYLFRSYITYIFLNAYYFSPILTLLLSVVIFYCLYSFPAPRWHWPTLWPGCCSQYLWICPSMDGPINELWIFKLTINTSVQTSQSMCHQQSVIVTCYKKKWHIKYKEQTKFVWTQTNIWENR